MTMLDVVRIRKLENGYTVKYHIASSEHPPLNAPDTLGQTSERFVATKDELAEFVFNLVKANVA